MPLAPNSSENVSKHRRDSEDNTGGILEPIGSSWGTKAAGKLKCLATKYTYMHRCLSTGKEKTQTNGVSDCGVLCPRYSRTTTANRPLTDLCDHSCDCLSSGLTLICDFFKICAQLFERLSL